MKKLTEIFNDIDFDDLKAIDLHKAVRFNKYIQENIAEAKAEKDANDFLKSTAICNKHSVNIDEWLFSFSIWLFRSEALFDSFGRVTNVSLCGGEGETGGLFG